MEIAKLHKWHQTKRGLFIFGLAELLAAYLIGSRALDTGSLIEYFLAVVLFIGALHNFSRLTGTLIHGNKAAKTR
jgi:hypothetical protein